MSGILKATAAILAAIGILGSIIGGFYKEKNATTLEDNKRTYITEEVIPPINGRS